MKNEMADQDDEDEKDKDLVDENEMTELLRIVASNPIAPVATKSIVGDPDIDDELD